MGDIYSSGVYLEHYPDWHLEDSFFKANEIQNIIERNRLEFRTLCDVGCGAGGVVKKLSEAYPGRRFFGSEPSSAALAKAKALDPDGAVDYRLGEFTVDIAEKIDVITCLDVFEHVPDQIQFLVELKPLADYKIFHVPLELSVNWLLRSHVIAERRRMPGHLHYYTKDIALAVLKEGGYDVLDWHYTAKPTHNLPLRTWIGSVLRKSLYMASPDKAAILFGGYSIMVLAK